VAEECKGSPGCKPHVPSSINDYVQL
jgi:hypothetical protein